MIHALPPVAPMPEGHDGPVVTQVEIFDCGHRVGAILQWRDGSRNMIRIDTQKLFDAVAREVAGA